MDMRQNPTTAVKVHSMQHVQAQGGFVNLSGQSHGAFGRTEPLEDDFHIEQTEHTPSNWSEQEFNVRKPLRVFQLSDIDTSIFMINHFHQMADEGHYYCDAPLFPKEVTSCATENVKISDVEFTLRERRWLQLSPCNYGVNQGTDVAWQMVTMLGRFTQPYHKNQTSYYKQIRSKFEEDYEFIDPELKAKEFLECFYVNPKAKPDLDYLLILNHLTVLCRQHEKQGGVSRLDPDLVLNVVDARLQDYISKMQHKLEAPRTVVDKSLAACVRQYQDETKPSSAGLKAKGGQPVNSTNPILSLYYGLLVRLMGFFLRNCVSNKIIFMCGEDMSVQLVEELFMRLYNGKDPLFACDVNQMDASHNPSTYKFFSALFSRFLERIYGVQFNFYDLFMQVTEYWFTRSTLFSMKAKAHFFLSSGLPWTLMLNTVACAYFSGILKPYKTIKFAAYVGDDSIECLINDFVLAMEVLNRFGVQVKPLYTRGYCEFVHRIFTKEGSSVIFTRVLLKLLCHRTRASVHSQEEFKEYFKGWKENNRRDLSEQRFVNSLAMNVVYHGKCFSPLLLHLSELLCIFQCTESNRLYRALMPSTSLSF